MAIESNELAEKDKPISTKGLRKDLIYQYRVLNGAKYVLLRNITTLFSIYTS